MVEGKVDANEKFESNSKPGGSTASDALREEFSQTASGAKESNDSSKDTALPPMSLDMSSHELNHAGNSAASGAGAAAEATTNVGKAAADLGNAAGKAGAEAGSAAGKAGADQNSLGIKLIDTGVSSDISKFNLPNTWLQAGKEPAAAASDNDPAASSNSDSSGKEGQGAKPGDNAADDRSRTEVLDDLKKWAEDQKENLNKEELADKLLDFAKTSDDKWNEWNDAGKGLRVDADKMFAYKQFNEMMFNMLDTEQLERIGRQIPFSLRAGE